jgi:hypothetical protein
MFRSFLVQFFLGLLGIEIMLSVYRDNLTFSFLIWFPFISFSCPVVLARNSKTLLNKSGESGTKLDEPIWAVIHLSIYLNTYVYIIYIIYIWKRYSEILCIAILTKKSFFFFFNKNRTQVLSGGCYQWEGEGYKERV